MEQGGFGVLVHGRVLADGEPVAGAQVTVVVHQRGGRRYADYLPKHESRTTTADDGAYVIVVAPEALDDDFFTGRSVAYDLSVRSGDLRTVREGTAWLLESGHGWRSTEQAGRDDPALGLTFDLARGTIDITSSTGGAVT
jgi:hypothetical protein